MFPHDRELIALSQDRRSVTVSAQDPQVLEELPYGDECFVEAAEGDAAQGCSDRASSESDCLSDAGKQGHGRECGVEIVAFGCVPRGVDAVGCVAYDGEQSQYIEGDVADVVPGPAAAGFGDAKGFASFGGAVDHGEHGLGVGDLFGCVVAVFVGDDDLEVFGRPDLIGNGCAYAVFLVEFVRLKKASR